MGHAHEELIIKIKYCGERVSPLLFDDEVGRRGATSADGGGGGAATTAAVVLWFPAPQAVIYIIKHT